jgi:PE family
LSFVIATPDILATAAADLANLGSAVNRANAAAATQTRSLVAAAKDEVSTAIAALFGSYGEEYRALSAQAAEFNEWFVQALNGSAGSYLAAEGADAAALLRTAQTDVLEAAAITAGAGAVSPHVAPVLCPGTPRHRTRPS